MKRPFDPKPIQSFRTNYAAALEEPADRRDGEVYVFRAREEVVLAVNVALVTGRPLLIFGAAGSGKSSLAASIARTLGWRYYEHVITSRTQAQDLLYGFDVVRRLADAQAASALSEAERRAFRTDLNRYIEPGVLWWAFDRESASCRGATEGQQAPSAVDPGRIGERSAPAVVLIDEIDKADPDVPNNLLVALGSLTFMVGETETLVAAAAPPLIIITTNEERDLPAALLRRCVTVRLPMPDSRSLVEIAEAHFGKERSTDYARIAERTVALAREYTSRGGRPPSTAEFLDCVRACLKLGVDMDRDDFEAVLSATVIKPETHGGDEIWRGR
jgi:MoxR-like ATPase